MSPSVHLGFWRDRTALVTGHTGFKGAWLSLWLQAMGARVVGLARGVPSSPSLYELARAGESVTEEAGDVCDLDAVVGAFARHAPDIVIHLAGQPLVRLSFAEPRATYETNVMGTINVLEAVRASPSVRVVVAVTSDRCYGNPWQHRTDGATGTEPAPRPFVETDPKGGSDPYSSSKACAELVVESYLQSFFATSSDGPRLASGRAGNVIGGGDWGEDRLIPDIMRGAIAGDAIAVRSPHAVRPWQHVLSPLSGLPAPGGGVVRHARAAGWLELRSGIRRRASRPLDRRPPHRAVARRHPLEARPRPAPARDALSVGRLEQGA